jgi:hypothetical protein
VAVIRSGNRDQLGEIALVLVAKRIIPRRNVGERPIA